MGYGTNRFGCGWIVLLAVAAAWGQQPKVFSSPDEAAKTLVEAAKQADLKAILDIFGANSKDLFPVGEEGERLRQSFVQAAAEKVHIDADPTNLGRAIIEVGETAWPFPISLISKKGQWQFDVEAGRLEIMARRIGANELSAITVCVGYIEAQDEYATADRNGDGVLEYAQRILSTPGKKDGLYWDGPDSPMAGTITKSFLDKFVANPPQAFNGYYFRTLTRQGPAADGGVMDYVVNKKWLIGGFALLAWPAEYGVTGVRSFIVNHDGVVYEKDLGVATKTAAAAIQSFNPDRTWRVVIEVDEDEEATGN